jgi:protein-S-isoprenylcysteine O-methyltransferase Ste14
VPAYGYLALAAGWLVWVVPFFRAHWAGKAAHRDRGARWGVALVGLGYALLWQGKFWERPLPAWRFTISLCFLALAGFLSWTGTHALGKQLRIDAGLSSDHQLVTSGPYRVVRHPIYTSMLCLILATGTMLSPLALMLPAIALFIAGTEIRVRIEERLLASRFGETFAEYQRRVPAYIPFVR